MLGRTGESYILLQLRLLAEIQKYLKNKTKQRSFSEANSRRVTNYHLCELFIEQLLSNKILRSALARM